MIYLDTHVVVWLYAGMIDELSVKVRNLINDHDILVSPIVQLELQYLFEIQRITAKPNEIVSDLSDRIGLKTCEKGFIGIVRRALDCSWTRDPFDRLIVAHAAIDQDLLVTKDQKILTNYRKAIW